MMRQDCVGAEAKRALDRYHGLLTEHRHSCLHMVSRVVSIGL